MSSTHLQSLAGGRVVMLTGMFGEPEHEIILERRMAITEAISSHGLHFRLPTIAILNGVPVLRKEWAVRMLRAGDTLIFAAVPGGGGGSSNGKQVMGLIAALALSVAAPFVGSFIATGLFGAGAVGTMAFSVASSLASAAFLVGGALLLNAMMPPPEPPGSMGAAERVYSVSATSNQATPLETLPVLYGRLRFPPRHASRPYSEYQGNDQYLYQLFLVTAGKADITKIEIGETEAWNSTSGYSTSFSDLTFEIVQPGDDITLFPANVVTATEVANQTLPDPPALLGPFVVNAAGTTVDRLAVDFAFPGGLWKANERAVASNSIAIRAQYRAIDNSGAPIGGWETLFAENISAATRTPQRMSRSAAVPAGRYEVQFLSDEAFDPADGTSVNTVAWTGLRGYLTDFVTPPNCTLLAMKIRANEQLSQFASNQIRVTAERYLPTWDGTEWVEQKTRSIAWAAADLLMNSDYSIGQTASQFDLATLTNLNGTFTSRNDNFDAIFDREWTAADALRAILRAGRTQAVRMGGTIGFVRLEPKLLRRAVFTPRNVVRGSFQHKLVLNDEEKPDSVLGQYIDATTWKEQEVLGALASVGSELPQKMEWFGITDHDHAWRESVTEAAVNAYCREFVSFTAEWEGKLLVRGEPILVQHPFIEMEAVQLATISVRAGDVLTIDRDLEHEITGSAYAIIRGKDGREWGPCLISSIVDRIVTLDAADRAIVTASMGGLSGIIPDDRSENAHILICDGNSRPFNGLVVSAAPNASGKVDILAVIDAPEVYLADATEVMPSPWTPPVLPPQNPARPLVLGLYAQLKAGIAQLELDAMWQPSAGAIGGYVAEVSYDDDSVPDDSKTWTPAWSGMANRFTVPVSPQKLVLRVAAVGVLQGPWVKKIFIPGDVPTILIPDDYLGLEGLANEIKGQVAEIEDWARHNTRETIEKQRQAMLLNVAGAVGDFTDRQTIRREASAQSQAAKAEWTEDILAATGPGSAIVTRVEELRAEVFDPVAGLPATATAVSLLSTEVHDPDTGLEAVGNSILSLTSSVPGADATGLFRIYTAATPAGANARIALSVASDSAAGPGAAALYMDSMLDGKSRILWVADQIAMTNGSFTENPFVFEGGVLTMRATRVQTITAGVLQSPDGKAYFNLNTKRLRMVM